jgi:hypothetical protein
LALSARLPQAARRATASEAARIEGVRFMRTLRAG